MIRAYRGKTPQVAASAYVDDAATVIGDVQIGEESSVWPGVVIRGDVHYVRIGSRTNIQDGSVLHVMRDEHPLILGDNVTIGHGVILHGCTIESRCLIGMGAIILNGARIGMWSIVAAGTLITEGTVVQSGSLFMGHPGKFHRAVTDADRDAIAGYADRYVAYKNEFRREVPASEMSGLRFRVGTTVDEAERELIQQTLAATNQNKTKAAELLGISLKTLHNKLNEYATRQGREPK